MSLSTFQRKYTPVQSDAHVYRRHGKIQLKRTTIDQDIDTLVLQLNALISKNKYKVKILCDDHERNKDIMDALKRLDSSLVVFTRLTAGDFILLLDDKLAYVIERKRMDDLAHSTMDGRLTKQTVNMSVLFPEFRDNPHACTRNIILIEKRHHKPISGLRRIRVQDSDVIVTIPNDAQLDEDIEHLIGATNANEIGDMFWCFGEEDALDGETLDRSRLMGSMINRMVRDDMRCVVSESSKYTVFWMFKVMLAMHNHGELMHVRMEHQPVFQVNSISEEHLNLTLEDQIKYLRSRQLPNAKNLPGSTAEEELKQMKPLSPLTAQFALQFLTIEGLTIGYVVALLQQYPSPTLWANYLHQHEHDPQKVVNDLRDIYPLHPTNGEPDTSKTRLGPKMAIRLFNHHFHTMYDVKTSGKLIVQEKNAEEKQETATETDAIAHALQTINNVSMGTAARNKRKYEKKQKKDPAADTNTADTGTGVKPKKPRKSRANKSDKINNNNNQDNQDTHHQQDEQKTEHQGE